MWPCLRSLNNLEDQNGGQCGWRSVSMQVFCKSALRCVNVSVSQTGFVSSLQPGTELSWLVNSDWFPLCSQWLSSAPEESMTQTSRQRRTMNVCERRAKKKIPFPVFTVASVCSPLQLSNVCLHISLTELPPLCPLLFTLLTWLPHILFYLSPLSLISSHAPPLSPHPTLFCCLVHTSSHRRASVACLLKLSAETLSLRRIRRTSLLTYPQRYATLLMSIARRSPTLLFLVCLSSTLLPFCFHSSLSTSF